MEKKFVLLPAKCYLFFHRQNILSNSLLNNNCALFYYRNELLVHFLFDEYYKHCRFYTYKIKHATLNEQ